MNYLQLFSCCLRAVLLNRATLVAENLALRRAIRQRIQQFCGRIIATSEPKEQTNSRLPIPVLCYVPLT